MRVVLTPTISVNLGTPRNIMSDMKLIKIDTDIEVQAGDVVRYNGKPCYVEGFDMRFVKIVTMDERKYSFSVNPQYIGCVIQRGDAK